MQHSLKLIAAATLLSVVSFSHASPVPKDPTRQSPQGLYVDAKETQAMMAKDPSVILVDVRTPEEWQFVGYTKAAQIMIPAVMFDYSQMDTKQNKPRYMPAPNPQWISQFEDKIADLGADEKTTYVIMCRSGATRAAPVAKLMDQYGYKNVYVMTDGFEGGKNKDGDLKGYRAHSGWKHSGAEWTYNIEADKVYFKTYGVKY
ncbi:rhodanese-like domain-containing protein [Thiosulfativibrio zosterae]|uniref:Rhodanese domain-containing protein n=1 Tax=Thiosulfativibrio zosterae TaxID=2675053 RepID=A0A6F8PN91_9GAMM|nr:rhodanese-like domain-containing protein [Thiosulfativibrio zosterae]BBP43518.1 hypothetical protein THMIRHAT_12640 [Thiosulfativibrio zosterae]